jgi:hypothetical protein
MVFKLLLFSNCTVRMFNPRPSIIFKIFESHPVRRYRLHSKLLIAAVASYEDEAEGRVSGRGLMAGFLRCRGRVPDVSGRNMAGIYANCGCLFYGGE